MRLRTAGHGLGTTTRCDACGASIAGDAAGHGVDLVVRDEAPRREELPLCRQCAHAIGMAALYRYAAEEEEG